MQHWLSWVIAKAHLIKNQITSESTDGLRLDWIGGLLRLSLDLTKTSQRRLTLLKFVEVVGDVSNGIDQHDQPRQVTAQPGNAQITGLNPPGS